MKKYSEQLITLGLAAFFYFAFVPESVSELTKPDYEEAVYSWTLNREVLTGDTLIHIAYDPFFKTAKTYRAFPLKQNLEKIIKERNLPGGLQLIFNCTDGYRPHMPLERVLSAPGFLAYKDEAVNPDQPWADSLTAKFPPFYLIWPEAEKGDHSFVNPYGLASIDFKVAETEFSAALPKDEAFMEGFELFSQTCMKCHSVNKVGGTLAPEFNYPKNITEYWAKEDIWGFMQKPTSYRYNAKMPPVKGMDRAEFEKIYAYLVSMKGRK